MSALVYLPAGRSIRRSDNAKWVDPQPEKGTIELSLDQGIVNFGESGFPAASHRQVGKLASSPACSGLLWA